MFRRVLTTILAVLVTSTSVAADVFEVSLEEAVALAHRGSPAAKRLDLESRRQTLSYGVAQRDRWPELRLNLNAPRLSQDFSVEPLPGAIVDTVVTGDGDTLTVQRQVFGKITTTRTNASGDMLFRQLLPWRGTLSANSSVYYRDESTDPSGVRAPRLDYQVFAQVGLDLQLLGDDPERRRLRRALVEHQMSRDRERASRAQLTFETTSRYLMLLRASLSLGILRAAVDQASRAYEQAGDKVRAGLIPEVEYLRVGVAQAERQATLAGAETRFARESDAFKVYLGMTPTDSLILSERLVPFRVEASLAGTVERALARRTEIGLGQREIELLEIDRRARAPYRPDVSLSMRYGGSSSEARLDDALDALSANTLSFQMQLSMPLWDAGRSTMQEEWEILGIRLRELELQDARMTIELEVRDAVRQLDDAERRHQLFQASTRLAEETLRISEERFGRGLIDADRYLLAQAEAASARLGRTGALLDLYQARARLRFVTLDEDS